MDKEYLESLKEINKKCRREEVANIEECLELIEDILLEYKCHIEPYDGNDKIGKSFTIPVLVDSRTGETRTFLLDRNMYE